MKNYIVYFIVEVYDGEEFRKDAGFLSADTFSEAMNYLEKYYGKELSIVHRMEFLDMSILTMTPEVAEEFINKIY